MRHRLGHNGLSRPTSHRLLMLRNLVSSLLQHEQITTTLAKAKETQKLADKVIQWGKKGGKSNWERANAYLLNPKDTLRPLFTTYATRYASRPGGYTRIHRAGFRQGDHAELAVLELVDSRNDLKFETAARTVGREMAIRAREGAGPEGWPAFRRRMEQNGLEKVARELEEANELHELTRKNVGKALAFRTNNPAPEVEATEEGEAPEADEDVATGATTTSPHPATMFLDRAYHHYLHSLATFSLSTTPTPDPLRTVKQLTQRLSPEEGRTPPKPVVTVPLVGRTPRAGERTDGWASTLEEDVAVEGSKRGGPIGRAKWSKGREARRQVYTGTKQSEEELAGTSS